jgi:NADH-quinone oxidoreductase subunit L
MQITPIPAELIWLIWLLPLAAFVLIVVMRFVPGRPKASPIAIGATLGSLGFSLWVLLTLLQGPAREIIVPGFDWLNIGGILKLQFGLLIDPLTAVMLLVVTLVSLMVQIYSRGYMHTDPSYRRYYTFISLFTFAMLGLVMADNLLLMFMCWELVGLCSYLLIGFWYQRPAAASAAKKAFMITRIGDVGFLAAVLMLYSHTATLDITQLHQLALAGAISSGLLTWITLGLFLGAMGKSAQFPLHIWLPDAMEGPTPVSALIHAATMVAAGVFLIARMFPLFVAVPHVLTIIAVVGGFTAIFAATMGLVMNDIKRVLAYSTISQLGYMMLGLATGGIAVGIFHLFNHAFFKALLFLGAGSLNHATLSFDMRQMGGLRKYMPWTFATFLIASLSLAGIWPLSGFFSKEEILAGALDKQPVLFAILLITAFMTAFYMFRVVFLVFGGKYSGNEHPHESPKVMLVPMLILAILAVFSGWLNANGSFNAFLGHGETHGFWEGILGVLAHPLSWISLSVAVLGIFIAYALYGARWLDAERIKRAMRPLYTLLIRKYWMDELYQDLIAKRILYNSIFNWFRLFDTKVVDGTVNGIAWFGGAAGRMLRKTQTGQLQFYGVMIIAGILVITLMMVLMR